MDKDKVGVMGMVSVGVAVGIGVVVGAKLEVGVVVEIGEDVVNKQISIASYWRLV